MDCGRRKIDNSTMAMANGGWRYAYSVATSAGVVSVSQEITVAIFGVWASSQAILDKLSNPATGFVFDGLMLAKKAAVGASTITFEVDVRDRDAELISSVVSCGAGRLNQRSIDAIREHSHYVVLTGFCEASGDGDLAQPDAVREVLRTVAQLIAAIGGEAVHVATAGITHTREAWLAMNAESDNSAVVNAFVQRIAGGGNFFSCGMHAFGFPDVNLVAPLAAQEGAKVLFEFLQLSVSGELDPESDNFLFKPRQGGTYKVSPGRCGEWEEDSAFYNRYGVWNLHPVVV